MFQELVLFRGDHTEGKVITKSRCTWHITSIYFVHNRGPYSVTETMLIQGGLTEGKVIKKVALNFILSSCVQQTSSLQCQLPSSWTFHPWLWWAKCWCVCGV